MPNNAPLTRCVLLTMQLWTLVTNYFLVDKFSFNFVIMMFWMCALPT